MAITVKQRVEDIIQEHSAIGCNRENSIQHAIITVNYTLAAMKVFHNGADWQLYERIDWIYWTNVKKELDQLK